MNEGNEIQFISSVSCYGVTSWIEKLDPYEFVLFGTAQTQKKVGSSNAKRVDWGTESYDRTYDVFWS